MQEPSNYNRRTNDKLSHRLLDGLLLNPGSTFDVLLKWTLLAALVWWTVGVIDGWIRSYNEPKQSIINGCLLPARLLTTRQLPTLSEPPKNATLGEEREWLYNAIDQYQVWAVDMVADRNDVISLCR